MTVAKQVSGLNRAASSKRDQGIYQHEIWVGADQTVGNNTSKCRKQYLHFIRFRKRVGWTVKSLLIYKWIYMYPQENLAEWRYTVEMGKSLGQILENTLIVNCMNLQNNHRKEGCSQSSFIATFPHQASRDLPAVLVLPAHSQKRSRRDWPSSLRCCH